jgi:hypothetical protein
LVDGACCGASSGGVDVSKVAVHEVVWPLVGDGGRVAMAVEGNVALAVDPGDCLPIGLLPTTAGARDHIRCLPLCIRSQAIRLRLVRKRETAPGKGGRRATELAGGGVPDNSTRLGVRWQGGLWSWNASQY